MKPKITLSLFIGLFCCLSQLTAQVQPTGTTCSDPIPISCGVPIATATTIGVANDNATSGAVGCITSDGLAGQIWYSLTATATNLVTISTCNSGTSFDTKIHVFTGTCGSFSCVTGNDDACGLQSTVTFATVEGQEYFVRVGGFASAAGTFGLSIACGDYTGGCMNPSASNYNPQATYDDGSCAFLGCTDPSAMNYNQAANTDDGSCQYCSGEGSTLGQMYVCSFANGAQIAITVTDPSGNVVADISGLGNNSIAYFDLCLQPGVCYDVTMSNSAGANGWSNGYFWINAGGAQVINESLNPTQSLESSFFSIDGTCISIPGCMDPNAMNYNPDANSDNGSCIFIPTCETGSVLTVNFNGVAFPNECSFVITDDSGTQVYAGGNYSSNGPFYDFICLNDGCYTVVMNDSFGDGWNGCNVVLTVNGISTSMTFASGYGSYGTLAINAEGCEPNVTTGCTNVTAQNYDPNAAFDDGSCVFAGCMDSGAVNFNPFATTDDGSCTYCNGEGSVLSTLYICTFANGGQVELQIVDDQGNEVYYGYNLPTNSIINGQVCLQPGVCYTANMINNTGNFGWYNGYFWVNAAGVQVVNAQPSADAQFQSVQFSIDGTCGPVLGCMDPNATNYDANATLENGSCVYPVGGCMDATAINYNPSATADDGSCIYVNDCQDNLTLFILNPGIFTNEASYTIVDANGAVVASGTGATTQYACLPDGCYTLNMFDTFGDGWDTSGLLTVIANGVEIGAFTLDPSYGTYASVGFGINAEGCTAVIAGCTDPAAMNYNPQANADDGSCYYAENCDGNLVTLTIATQTFGSEMSWNLVGADGAIYASGSGYSSWNFTTYNLCLPDGCYELFMNDSWGDGWNGGYYMISSANDYYEGSLLYGADGVDIIGINSACGLIAGCTDAAALNYNPSANYEDGSCTYNNDGNTGIGLGLEIEYSIYPNPANSGIIVNLNHLNSFEGVRLNIMSMDGKIVSSNFYPNNEGSRALNLNVSDLSAGYYFVQMINGENVKVLPLIKE